MRNRLSFFTLMVVGLLISACAHQQPKAEKPTDTNTTKLKPQKIKMTVTKGAPIILNKELQAFTCNVRGDDRVVTLNQQAKRCKVFYKKSGDQVQVAWGENTPSVCRDVFNNIRQNIEGRGFKCTTGLQNKVTARSSASQ